MSRSSSDVYKELKWNNAPPLDADKLIQQQQQQQAGGLYNNNQNSISNHSIHLPSATMTMTACTTAANPVPVMTSEPAMKATTNASSLSSPPPVQEQQSVSSATITTMPLQADKTALLVVDVQPEYWSQCPAVRQDFPHFPERLAQTVETCRQRKINKIIWVRADYRYEHSPWLVQFARIHQMKIFQNKTMRDEIPCDPTSANFTWETFAVPQGGDVIIPKSSWSSTSNTSLMDVLRVSGVDTVLVCGLITSVCVQHSAFGVFEAGYRTILVTDACADRGMARHQAALALYGDYMYELVSCDELQTQLIAAQPVWVTPQTLSHVSPMLTPVSSAVSLNRMDSVASGMSTMTLGPPAARNSNGGSSVQNSPVFMASSSPYQTSVASGDQYQQHPHYGNSSPIRTTFTTLPPPAFASSGAATNIPASVAAVLGNKGALIAPRSASTILHPDSISHHQMMYQQHHQQQHHQQQQSNVFTQ